MDMKKTALRLDNLPDQFIEQELALLDYFLAQISYANRNTVEIEVKNISKDIFKKTHSDWWQRILEIIDRFQRLGVVSNFQLEALGNSQVITIHNNEEPLRRYRNLLAEEQVKRNSKSTTMFCHFEDGIFYLDRDMTQNPLALNFSTVRGNTQISDLMDILFGYWKENYLSIGVYGCIVPRASIVTQMRKRGQGEFNEKQLGDAKNYLKKKLLTEPEIGKHITIAFRGESNSYFFEITPYTSKPIPPQFR